MLIFGVSSAPSACPDYFYTNGYFNDLGLLADSVSWNDVKTVEGVCHTYNIIFESSGVYDTRLRVYSTDNLIVFTFRPTQQSSGGDIHVNRRLVPVTFFNGSGLVNDRFQVAFISLIKDFDFSLIGNKTVLMGAHSLGSSLTQYAMVNLQEVYNITTKLSVGLAGPFISNRDFYERYQKQFKENNVTTWWQVETVDKYNNVDGTTTGYNCDYPPYIYIPNEAVCGLYITVQEGTYGMHDLINYRSGLRGNICNLNF